MKTKTKQPQKQSGTIVTNRRARRNYDIIDTVEAGLVLTGTEIKAIREGRVNLSDAYGKPENGELWLVNAHIAQYSAGSRKQPRPYPSAQTAAAQRRNNPAIASDTRKRSHPDTYAAIHQEAQSESRTRHSQRTKAARQAAGNNRARARTRSTASHTQIRLYNIDPLAPIEAHLPTRFTQQPDEKRLQLLDRTDLLARIPQP